MKLALDVVKGGCLATCLFLFAVGHVGLAIVFTSVAVCVHLVGDDA